MRISATYSGGVLDWFGQNYSLLGALADLRYSRLSLAVDGGPNPKGLSVIGSRNRSPGTNTHAHTHTRTATCVQLTLRRGTSLSGCGARYKLQLIKAECATVFVMYHLFSNSKTSFCLNICNVSVDRNVMETFSSDALMVSWIWVAKVNLRVARWRLWLNRRSVVRGVFSRRCEAGILAALVMRTRKQLLTCLYVRMPARRWGINGRGSPLLDAHCSRPRSVRLIAPSTRCDPNIVHWHLPFVIALRTMRIAAPTPRDLLCSLGSSLTHLRPQSAYGLRSKSSMALLYYRKFYIVSLRPVWTMWRRADRLVLKAKRFVQQLLASLIAARRGGRGGRGAEARNGEVRRGGREVGGGKSVRLDTSAQSDSRHW